MADQNEVQIRFTASTGDVTNGIAEVHGALGGLRQDVANVAGALAGLQSAFSVALPADKLDNARKAFDSLGDQTARTTLQLREMNATIRAADAAYSITKQHLATELKLHEITYEEETKALLAALDQRLAREEKAIADELLLAQRGSEQYNKLLAERAKKEARYYAERQRIVDQAALHEAQQWKAVADQIASAFNSNLQKLLAGTETWSQAMKKISASLILKLIEDQIKVTLEFLANQARQVAAHLAGEGAKTSATTAGAALRNAVELASGQTSILQTLANALKAIFASAGQTAAAVTATVAPEAGPAAPAIGMAAGVTTATEAVGLAHMDVGGYVLRSGLAVVHQGEVIPAAKVSMPYMGGGMGMPMPLLVERALQSLGQHSDAMAGMVDRHSRVMNDVMSELFLFRQATKRFRGA